MDFDPQLDSVKIGLKTNLLIYLIHKFEAGPTIFRMYKTRRHLFFVIIKYFNFYTNGVFPAIPVKEKNGSLRDIFTKTSFLIKKQTKAIVEESGHLQLNIKAI